MKSDWQRLLSLRTQPKSLRECYELLEPFFEALERPAGTVRTSADAGQGARLGYLIAAARLIAGVRPHPSWLQLERQLRSNLATSHSHVLLEVDSEANPLDELARSWRLRKGLDSSKLVQIAQYGAS